LSRSEVGIQSFIQTVQTPICSTGHLVYLLLSSYRSQYNNAPIFMPHGTHSFLHIVRCRTGEARSIQLGLEAEDGRKISVAPSEGRVSFQGPRQNQTEQKPGGGPNSSRPPSRFLFLLCARSLMQLVFAEPRCPCSILPSSDWCAYEDEIIVTLNSRALEFFRGDGVALGGRYLGNIHVRQLTRAVVFMAPTHLTGTIPICAVISGIDNGTRRSKIHILQFPALDDSPRADCHLL